MACQEAGASTLLEREPRRAALLIWLRSVLCSMGILLAYASIDRLPLGDFISVYSTRVFLIAGVCYLILREAFGWRLRVAAVISTAAVLLIVKPPFIFGAPQSGSSASRAIGFGLTAGCLAFDALEMLTLRALGPGPEALVMTLAYAITTTVCAPLYMLIDNEGFAGLAEPILYAKIVAIALFGFSAQMCLVMATQRETGGRVGIISYSQIPMAIAAQIVFMGDLPDALGIFGMVAIVVVGVWSIITDGDARDKETETDGSQAQPLAEAGYALLPTEEGYGRNSHE